MSLCKYLNKKHFTDLAKRSSGIQPQRTVAWKAPSVYKG
jgi:hypothetical protein